MSDSSEVMDYRSRLLVLITDESQRSVATKIADQLWEGPMRIGTTIFTAQKLIVAGQEDGSEYAKERYAFEHLFWEEGKDQMVVCTGKNTGACLNGICPQILIGSGVYCVSTKKPSRVVTSIMSFFSQSAETAPTAG